MATPGSTEFSAGISASSYPRGITAGPDGNLWFTEASGDRVGRITPAGAVTEFSAGISSGSYPAGITRGPDGNLWFTESVGNRIGRITPAGTVTEFSAGISAGSYPEGIAAGPDGNLWFTEAIGDRIGRITPAGVVTEFSAGIGGSYDPEGIVAGPDGNLWFNEFHDRIGRITPAGVVTLFSAGITGGGQPAGIAAGPDGNLWFTEARGDRIGRITPAGVVTEFSPGISAGSYPKGITAGPDGNLWFTEYVGDRVGRITPAGVVTEFSAGITPGSAPDGIAAGADGNMWFTEPSGGRVARIADLPPAATTGGASAISQSGAIVAGTVAARTQPTRVSFQYGPSAAYGSSSTTQNAGANLTPADVSAALSGLAAGTIYHYRLVATNASGTSYGSDATFTTLAAAPSPPAVAPKATLKGPPTLTRLSLSPSSFRAATRGASATRRTGAMVSYSLDREASATFSVQRARAGRQRGRRCGPPTRRGRHGHRCTRYVTLTGRFIRAGHIGNNRFHFTGRIGSRRLAPGTYRLIAIPKVATQAGSVARVNFRIKR